MTYKPKKLGQTDLVSSLWPEFIRRYVQAGIQVSMCCGDHCATPVNALTHRGSFWPVILLAQPASMTTVTLSWMCCTSTLCSQRNKHITDVWFLANHFLHRPFPFLPDWCYGLSVHLMFLFCSMAGFVCMVTKPALSRFSNTLKIIALSFHFVYVKMTIQRAESTHFVFASSTSSNLVLSTSRSASSLERSWRREEICDSRLDSRAFTSINLSLAKRSFSVAVANCVCASSKTHNSIGHFINPSFTSQHSVVVKMWHIGDT